MTSLEPNSTPRSLPEGDSARIFLSYSRREFYFAESLAIRLQHSQIHTWFDSQQIAVGERWAQDIQQGLIEASSLVLVASKASIASPYVGKEWQYALEHSKPVHVVFFEAVELPPELFKAAATILDGRSGFEAVFPRLLACLKGEQQFSDPLPKQDRFGLPARVPAALRTLVMSRLVLFLIYALIAASYALSLIESNPQLARFAPVVVVVLLFGFGFGAFRLLKVLRRTFVHRDVIQLTSYGETLILALWVVSVLYRVLNYGLAAFSNPLEMISVVLVIGYLAYWWRVGRLAKWHIDFLCWYPLTAGPPVEWRAIAQKPYLDEAEGVRLHAPVAAGEEPQYPMLTEPVKRDPAPNKTKWFEIKIEPHKTTPAPPAVISSEDTVLKGKTFQIFHGAGDAKPAGNLKAWLASFGMTASAEGQKADFTLLYLTHRTPKSLAFKLSAEHPSLICVLGESINRPADMPDSFQSIQWLDYRDRSSGQLFAALCGLVDKADSDRAVQALNTTPPQLGKLRLSPDLHFYWQWLGFAGTGCLGVALTGLAFLVGVILNGTLNPQVGLGALWVLALLATAIWFYRMAGRGAAFQPVQRVRIWLGLILGMVLVGTVPWVAVGIAPTPLFFDRVVMVVILVFIWFFFIAAEWVRRRTEQVDVLAPEPDAFGPASLPSTRDWFKHQGVALLLVLLLVNVLWTGVVAFGNLVFGVLFGQ